MIDLIYQDPQSLGKIFQTSYLEIPHDLAAASIHLVIYTAAEKPPLAHHRGAVLEYHPSEDKNMDSSSPLYAKTVENAKRAATSVSKVVKDGKNALIVCNQGINRSSLVTAFSIKRISNLTSWEVINLIKAKRQGTLTNGSFMSMILGS